MEQDKRQLIIELLLKKGDFEKQIQNTKKNLGKLSKNFTEEGLKEQAEAQENLRNKLKSVNQNLKIARGETTMYAESMKKINKNNPFPGFALTILFAGMSIKRTFSSISKSALSVFKDVSHSIANSSTNIDILSGGFKYLQFAVGNAISTALEPLIPFLMKTIMFITELVNNNPELVAGIIAFGLALGTLMTVGGGLYLLINGLKQVKELLTFMSGTEGFNKFLSSGKTALTGLKNLALITVGLIWAKDAFDKFKEGKWLQALSSVLMSAGAFTAMVHPGVGAALVLLGVGLKFISDPDFAKDLTTAIMTFVGIVGSALNTLFSAIWNTAKENFSRILSGLEKIAKAAEAMLEFDFSRAKRLASGGLKEIFEKPTMWLDYDFAGEFAKTFEDFKPTIEEAAKLAKRFSEETMGIETTMTGQKIGSDATAADVLSAIDTGAAQGGSGTFVVYGNLNVNTDSTSQLMEEVKRQSI